MPRLIVVVPLYRNPGLAEALIGSLSGLADELRALDATVVFINDSPDDHALANSVHAHLPVLEREVEVRLLVNPENLGFIQTVNKGLDLARSLGADAIILNSDALPTPGALTEMVAVSKLDPMTSVVSPRSNNATICNSPYPSRYRSLSGEAAFEAHRRLQQHLPRSTYVPTAVGFCLLIRGLMLKEFGLFDEIYGHGYGEENDFIMRCNRRGYRAVLANHAFVHHLGGASFALTGSTADRQAWNHRTLLARYPEYERTLLDYQAGAEFSAQRLAAGLLGNADGRPTVLFDCRHFLPLHNGTFGHARALIDAFVAEHRSAFEIFVAADEGAYLYHEFDRIEGLTYCWGEERRLAPFTAVFRPCQPFNRRDMVDVCELAPITGFLVLDAIALDCAYLNEADYMSLWQQMTSMASFVCYNSDFTRKQFTARVAVPDDVLQFTSRCSTDVRDYMPARWSRVASAPHIFVAGNAYAHKGVSEAIDMLLEAVPDARLVGLGLDGSRSERVRSLPSGDLSDEEVDDLYAQASVVVFPSHYEGFGLPVMRALAHGKPVLVRDLPAYHEIRDRSPFADNVIICRDLEHMAARMAEPIAWTERRTEAVPQDWADAARRLAEGITAAVDAFAFGDLLRRTRVRLDVRAIPDWEDPALRPTEGTWEPGIVPVSPTKRTAAAPRNAVDLGAVLTGRTKLAAGPLGDAGRKLSVSHERPIGLLPDNAFELVEAELEGAGQQPDITAARLLDLTRKVRMGGTLRLRGAGRTRSPVDSERLLQWLSELGFSAPEWAGAEGDTLTVAKNRDWAGTTAPPPSDPREFVRSAWDAVLGTKPSTPDQIHWTRELRRGVPRSHLLNALWISRLEGEPDAAGGISVPPQRAQEAAL